METWASSREQRKTKKYTSKSFVRGKRGKTTNKNYELRLDKDCYLSYKSAYGRRTTALVCNVTSWIVYLIIEGDHRGRLAQVLNDVEGCSASRQLNELTQYFLDNEPLTTV